MVFSIIFVLLGGFYAYMVIKKWDYLRTKIGSLSQKEFMPEKKWSVFYVLLFVVVANFSVAWLTVTLGNPELYGGPSQMLEQHWFYLGFTFALLPLGGVLFFALRDEDRVRGLYRGIFYVVSTLLLFGAIVAVVWMVYLAIIAIAVYVALMIFIGDDNSSSSRITLDDGTVIKKSSGILGGDSYESSSGASYKTNDGGKSFYRD